MPSGTGEVDSARVLSSLGVITISNALRTFAVGNTSDDCQLRCMVEGCFTEEQRCDGRRDCDDGCDNAHPHTDFFSFFFFFYMRKLPRCLFSYDERGCRDEVDEFRALHKRYLLSRRAMPTFFLGDCVRCSRYLYYLLFRQSRFEDFYDIGDGDWGWFEVNVDHDGEQFITLGIPETPDDFYFHLFRLANMGKLYLYNFM